MKDKGTVNIHGKEYETVASRVQRFRKQHGDKYGIVTEIVSRNDDMVVLKALIIRYGEVLRDKDGAYTDQAVIATGYAEESRASSQINRTSALENAETSAIGRALAAFGMAGTEYASADEVAQAISQHSEGQQPSSEGAAAEPASIFQKGQITTFLRALGVPDDDMVTYVSRRYGMNLKQISKRQAVKLLKDLQ